MTDFHFRAVRAVRSFGSGLGRLCRTFPLSFRWLGRRAVPVFPMLLTVLSATAEKTVFHDQISGCEIWRMTNAPDTFYTHTYVEVPSIDPTGQWVAFHGIERGAVHREGSRVYVADLATGEIRDLGPGSSPVWDYTRAVLYFTRKTENGEGLVIRADPASGNAEPVAPCPGTVAGTTLDGRYAVFVADNAIQRVELKPEAKPEVVLQAPPGIQFGGHMRHNPRHPWMFILAHKEGESLNGPCFVVKDDGSEAHRYDWFGEYIGHMSWSANGSGILRANVPWPAYKPFPLRADTPWLTLSAGKEFWPNHIGRLGNDERLVATDNDNQSLFVTDTLMRHSSRLCYASGFSVPYSKDGDPHAVGSPDGTKLQFDSCYNLRDRGLTVLSEPLSAEADAIAVADTTHFPDEGLIMLGKYSQPEFVRYTGKDATRLLNCIRGCLPKLYESAGKWKASPGPRAYREGTVVTEYFGRFQTPGVPRGPDIYVAVVRDPAPPRSLAAHRTDKGVELSWEPPELHNEIVAYRVERSRESGRGFATVAARVMEPAYTDTGADGEGPFFYRAIALEHSGLESTPSWETMYGGDRADSLRRRLFIEGESCSFVGQGGLEFSSGCYGRTYVASEGAWIAVPFTLSQATECAVWLRVRTPQETCSLKVWSIRQQFTCQGNFGSPGTFSWQRLSTDSGEPLLFPADSGENTITLQGRNTALDLDRICITDDLDFVPPDEPNAKLPAPEVTGKATGPHSAELSWRLPGDGRALLYEIRDAETRALIASTHGQSYVFDNLRINSERAVCVIPVSRFGTPGEASGAVSCRPAPFALVQDEIEVESCPLEAPMVGSADPAASGGGAVALSYRNAGTGTVRVAWTAPAEGDYLIAVRTKAWWPEHGSFTVMIDGNTTGYLATPTPYWSWQPVTKTPTSPGTAPTWTPITLGKGEHKLEFATDADGLLLDTLLISNDIAWRPPVIDLPSRPVEVTTLPCPGREALIPPGEKGRFSLRLQNRQSEPLSCRLDLAYVSEGIAIAPQQYPAALTPGEYVPVPFTVTADRPDRQGYAHILVSAEEWQEETVLPVRALATPITLLHLEAEDGTLSPDAKIAALDGADGGKFVEFEDGTLVFDVDLPKEADYTIWVRQFAPVDGFGYFGSAVGAAGTDSFRIIGPWEKVLDRWCWLTSPRKPVHHWPAGKMRLEIKRRGGKFRRIDAIVITDDPDYEPGW